MMIDRTSFDETDDFNVDQLAKTKAMEACVPAPPVVMKDGKVRRRLRWRPKGMTKRRKPPPPPPPMSSLFPFPISSSLSQSQQTNNNNSLTSIPSNLVPSMKLRNNYSSGCSVVSQTSRQSKKSMHSFASTETACVNNKTATRRKNALLSNFSASTSTTAGSRPIQPQLGNVATIGNEGDFIHARIHQNYQNHALNINHHRGNFGKPNSSSNSNNNNSSTIFEAADAALDEFSQQQGNRSRGDSNKAPVSGIRQPQQRGAGSKPPLFQRPGIGGLLRNAHGNNNLNDSTSTESLSVSNISLDDSLENGSYNANNTSMTSAGTASLIPVPVLSGDEVENERRVDLRIRKSSSFTSQSSQMSGNNSTPMVKKNMVDATAMLEDGVEPLSIHELRFDEERQDVNNPLQGGIRRMKSSSSTINHMKLMATTSSSQPSSSNLSWSPSLSSGQQQEEMRFSMSNVTSKQQQGNSLSSQNRNNDSSHKTNIHSNGAVEVTIPKIHTCPVDVDQGTFLEAEKNLQAIHEMASEHLRQGECTEALEVFEEILRGQLARFGPDHYRVGTALHNIGIVHMRQKDFTRALTVYKEAVRIRKKTLHPFHPDVAASLAQLGVAYMEREKYRKAIGAFREALKIRRICLGNDHPKVAKILNNIGCSLFELNELEVAMVAFEEALDIQRNLLRNPIDGCPVTESSLLSIASTQSNIASIKLYCGHFDEALIDLEEALLIQQCALGDDHPLARRTQESIRWMETTRRKSRPAAVSVDLLTQLTGDSISSNIASSTIASSTAINKDRVANARVVGETNNTNQNRRTMLSSNMFDALLARLDLACGGWDPAEEFENDNGSYHSGDTESDRSSTE